MNKKIKIELSDKEIQAAVELQDKLIKIRNNNLLNSFSKSLLDCSEALLQLSLDFHVLVTKGK